MTEAFASLQNFPLPYWMVIFAEGTRFTAEKQAACEAHALATGKPVLKVGWASGQWNDPLINPPPPTRSACCCRAPRALC